MSEQLEKQTVGFLKVLKETIGPYGMKRDRSLAACKAAIDGPPKRRPIIIVGDVSAAVGFALGVE